jgi:hypothetical protein
MAYKNSPYLSAQNLLFLLIMLAKNTSLKLGKKARLFFKYSNLGKYFSEYVIEFEK